MFKTRNHMKNLANSSFVHTFSDEELRMLQVKLLAMYKDIYEVCNKYNLTLFLGGGSALGAVRHGGFIPWDDDMDLNMLRTDYNKLISVFDHELSDKYEITVPNSSFGTADVFMKIYLKNTINIGVLDFKGDAPVGIWVDIFPIDFVSDKPIKYYTDGIILNAILFIGSSVRFRTLKNNILKEYTKNSILAKINYYIRVILGLFFSFFTYKKWYAIHDRKASSIVASSVVSIPSGRKHYFGETYNLNDFFPPRKTMFSEIEANLPNNFDKYLRIMYGDYMEIPSKSQREKHFAIKFKIDDSEGDIS